MDSQELRLPGHGGSKAKIRGGRWGLRWARDQEQPGRKCCHAEGECDYWLRRRGVPGSLRLGRAMGRTWCPESGGEPGKCLLS